MSGLVKKVRGTLLLDGNPQSIKKAAVLLQAGGLVAFPTETVYGLGAIATDPKAVGKIFLAKGRPADNPLIVHISNLEQLEVVIDGPSPEALYLIRRFWPGPLSLVLKRNALIAPEVSAGLPTVAVRMPDHPLALQLIEAAGAPIAAPSANLAGRPSPTSPWHVLEDLTGLIDAVIMGQHCRIGVESTVLDLSGRQPVILRPGGLSREELETALNCRIPIAGSRFSAAKPSSPGMKYRHYAPKAHLILITGPPARRKALLETLAAFFRRQGLQVAILNSTTNKGWGQRDDPDRLAANLYRSMRLLDAAGTDLILAEETVNTGLGLAVMNRLRKAARRVLKI
jgi:L-threonylcarbamoyladenylate synthase